jgi:hypothetical protein
VDQNLQAGRVARQLEQPQDPDDADEVHQLGLRLEEEVNVDVEAESGCEVYYVDGRLDEFDHVRSHLNRQNTTTVYRKGKCEEFIKTAVRILFHSSVLIIRRELFQLGVFISFR